MNTTDPANHDASPAPQLSGRVPGALSNKLYRVSVDARPRFPLPAMPYSEIQRGIPDQQEISPETFNALRAGNTPVTEIAAISDYFGIRTLFIKDESHNPFGTHKDRKSYYAVQTSQRRENMPDALCIITAGNAGLSLAAFAATFSLPVIAFVGSPAPAILQKLEEKCEQVVQIDLQSKYWSSSELRNLSQASGGRDILDISNLAAPYRCLAREIRPYQPDFIVLPVGGGELFVGLASGLRELGLRTRLIGVTVRQRHTAADKLYAKWTPYRARVRRLTSGSSPHRLFYLDDESTLGNTLKTLSPFLRCESSSAVPFDLLRRLSFRRTDRVMVLNTGSFREMFCNST